jgi:hypothetical protein
MKYLLTLIIFVGFFFGFSNSVYSQKKYNALNIFMKFGSDTRINAHYEITVGKSITISPSIAMPFDFDWLALGGRADLYFDNLFNINKHWDMWLGVDTGIIINGDDTFSLNAHAGVEYKFTDFIGIIAEIGGGTASFGGIGLGFHF